MVKTTLNAKQTVTMKRILSTIVLALTMLVSAHADTWTIAGAVYKNGNVDETLTATHFGSQSGWVTDYTANDMILYGGTTKYYLIKEITLDATSEATIKFKVCKNHTWDVSHGYGNLNGSDNDGGNAWLFLKNTSSEAKTYKLLFTFDSSDDGTLDVIQLGKLVEGNDYSTPTDEATWSSYLGTNVMTLDEQGTFHFTKDYTIASANTNMTIKALTIHRSPTYADKGKTNNNVQKAVDNVNGVATTNPNYYVNFANKGNYEVEFEYNVLTNQLNVTTRRYHDATISVEGNGLGTGAGTGYATFSCDFATEVPSDVTAYYITGTNGDQMVSELTDRVPAAVFSGNNYPRTGVVLKGELGTYRFYEYTGNETITLTNNKLCGTGSRTDIDVPYSTRTYYYVLGKVGNKIAFYKAECDVSNSSGRNTFPAYKAFFYTGTVHAREYYTLDFMDDATGIEALLPEPTEEGISDNTYYTLLGIPVAHPTRGIYLHRGKKVVMK